MKIISIIFGIILAMFAILTVLAPKEFIVERTITVNKPIAEVFESLKYLKNHEDWNA